MAENVIDAHDLETIERILAATTSTSGSGVLPRSVLRCLADLFPGAVAGVVSDSDGASSDSLQVSFASPDQGRPVHVCVTRSEPPFSIRDRILFDLLAPRLEDLIVEGRRQHDRQSLSPGELRVLRLVAEGASNAEVSAQLSVSVATVRKHLEHVYLKLGVRNRTAAARVLGSGGSPPMDPSG